MYSYIQMLEIVLEDILILFLVHEIYLVNEDNIQQEIEQVYLLMEIVG